jgi:hypothetical protein
MIKGSVLFIFILVSSSFGEDSSNKFFTKDYAKNPLEQVEASPKPSRVPPNQENKLPKGDIAPQNPQRNFSEVDTSKETLTNEAGRPVKWIGLIVTSDPPAQMSQVFKTMQKLVRRHDFGVGLIYIIGTRLSPQNGSILNELMMRGGELKVRGRSPKHFSAKRSPTWIIELEKGEVLLDGILDPTFFFNEDGHYVGDPDKISNSNE